MKHTLSMCFLIMTCYGPLKTESQKSTFQKQTFSKTQWFYDRLNILDRVALMTKQFTAYFVQKFECKDKVGCKGFKNGWKI